MKEKIKHGIQGILVVVSVFVVLLGGCSRESRNAQADSEIIIQKLDESPIVVQKNDIDDLVPEISDSEPLEDTDDEEILAPVEELQFDSNWEYAEYSVINSGTAKLYRASSNRRDIVVGINAGHGTKGGTSKKTYCHPDKTAKVTGGTTPQGSIKAPAVSSGMRFLDGAHEADVTLEAAILLKDKLLDEGYDVLMLREDSDVQLDNVARTVIANNNADCLISLHWDGDGLNYDKGCFYISTPDGIKSMSPVAENWKEHHRLGDCLISGLKEQGCKIYNKGSMAIDLTQTSYSCIPSIDIELGNQASAHDEAALSVLAEGMIVGINQYYDTNVDPIE